MLCNSFREQSDHLPTDKTCFSVNKWIKSILIFGELKSSSGVICLKAMWCILLPPAVQHIINLTMIVSSYIYHTTSVMEPEMVQKLFHCRHLCDVDLYVAHLISDGILVGLIDPVGVCSICECISLVIAAGECRECHRWEEVVLRVSASLHVSEG